MAASPPPKPGRIFISYRRGETAYPAGWLYDRLAEHYDGGQVFKDVDSIELGDDFVEVITRAVGSCDVLLALIGQDWLTITDADGRRRLDDPHDFVRLEIEAALARNVRIIPILLGEARMPHAEELPNSLSKLARRQALELAPARFNFDTGRLLKVLDRELAEIRATGAEPDAITGVPQAPAATLPPTHPQRRRSARTWLLAGGIAVVLILLIVAVLVNNGTPSSPSGAPSPSTTAGTATTSAPGPTSMSTVERAIPATQVWTDMNLHCASGDRLQIAVSGTVMHTHSARGDPAGEVGPNGLTDPRNHRWNVPGLPDANAVAVIGSLDRALPLFVVGSGTTYSCPRDGALFLGVNDIGVQNNSGKFTAKITKTHSG